LWTAAQQIPDHVPLAKAKLGSGTPAANQPRASDGTCQADKGQWKKHSQHGGSWGSSTAGSRCPPRQRPDVRSIAGEQYRPVI
jgi:hypothetical protein